MPLLSLRESKVAAVPLELKVVGESRAVFLVPAVPNQGSGRGADGEGAGAEHGDLLELGVAVEVAGLVGDCQASQVQDT